MFTGGVGGLIELPNFTVMVQGLDEWNYSRLGDADPTIHEPRLLAAVRARYGSPAVSQLRAAPWMEGQADDPNGPANQVGVPVLPFPAWFRCTSCSQLSSLDSGAFGFTNQVASRPFEAQFVHKNCRRRDRFAVPARFLVGCLNGHLDEFPFAWFVHRGEECAESRYPSLRMIDFGRDAAANVRIECASCGKQRNMLEAQGRGGMENLPACRGRHAHLGVFDQCDQPSRLLVLGASNQWFGTTVNALSVPPSQASALETAIDRLWDRLRMVTSYEVMEFAYAQLFAADMQPWPIDEVWSAVEGRRARESGEMSAGVSFGGMVDERQDLLGPEWLLLTADPPPEPSADFAVRSAGVPSMAAGLIADVRQVERLRLVRALIGFTRFDAPDPDDPELVTTARLSREAVPNWVPATEVRGEGLFVRLHPEALAAWERRASDPIVRDQHRQAFGRFQRNRYSERIPRPPDWDWAQHWPGLRYYLIHSLAHVVLRAISLECGYAAASLAERIYARDDDSDSMAGFLIYTSVPDAEGTLGGLVSLGEPGRFSLMLERALGDARACSSDPLCAETVPSHTSDACYAASCHVCMFLSETSCERGNRFLDRRLVVDLGWPELAFWPGSAR
jgi:hypothetical protein